MVGQYQRHIYSLFPPPHPLLYSSGKHEVKTVVRSKELNPKWDENLNLDQVTF